MNSSTLPQSTTSVPDQGQVDATLYLEQGFSGEQLNNGEVGEGGGASYMQVRYKFDSNNHFRARQYIEHSYDSDKANTNVNMGDLALQYDRKKWFQAGALEFSGSGRLYLPTGESHRDTGETQLRGYLNTSYPLTTNLSASFESSPRFYRYFKSVDADGDNKRFLKWNNRLGAKYKVSSNFSAQVHFLVSDQTFYNTVNYNRSKAGLDFLFTLDLTDNLAAELFVENLSNDWEKSPQFLNADETDYYLSLIASI